MFFQFGAVGFFALLFGRVHVFFAVWSGGERGGGCVFCCLMEGEGEGVMFVFAVWAEACSLFCCLGGGREFTHLPACLL